MKLKNHVRGTSALIIKGPEIDVRIFRAWIGISFEINLLCLPGLAVVDHKKFHAPSVSTVKLINID